MVYDAIFFFYVNIFVRIAVTHGVTVGGCRQVSPFISIQLNITSVLDKHDFQDKGTH